MKSLTRALAAALLIAACAAAPASAHRAWVPPEQLAGPGTQANQPALAVAGQGDVIATWETEDDTDPTFGLELWSAIKQPGQATQIHKLSAAGSGSLTPVAADDAGNAIAVFSNSGGPPQLVRRPAGGTFGAPTALPDSAIDVVANANGQAAIVYLRFGSPLSLYVSFGSTTGAFSAPVPLAEDIAYGGQVAVKMTPSGEVIAAWTSKTTWDTVGAITSAIRAPGDAAPTVQALSTPGHDAYAPTLSTDRAGEALLTWQEGGSGLDDPNRAAERDPGQPFGAAHGLGTGGRYGQTGYAGVLAGDGTITAVGPLGVYGGRLHGPLVKIDDQRFNQFAGATPYVGGDRVLFTWVDRMLGQGEGIYLTAGRDRDGAIGPIEDLDPGCNAAGYVLPAVGSGGDAAAMTLTNGTMSLSVDAPVAGATNQRCSPAAAYSGTPTYSPPPPSPNGTGPIYPGPTPGLPVFRLALGKAVVKRTSTSRTLVLPVDCGFVCVATVKATLRVHGGKTIGTVSAKQSLGASTSYRGRISVKLRLTKTGRKLVARYRKKLEFFVRVTGDNPYLESLHGTTVVRTK